MARKFTFIVCIAFVAIGFTQASEEACFASSADFVSSGYFLCATNNGDVQSFFECLSQENLVDGEVNQHKIEQEIKNISNAQNNIIDSLKEGGILPPYTRYDAGFMRLKSEEYYLGPDLGKNLIFSRKSCGKITKDDYLNYLQTVKSLKCNFRDEIFSKPCKEWNDIVEREILVHQQIPVDCYCLIKEHEKDFLCNMYLGNMSVINNWTPAYKRKIMNGADFFREACNEYSTSHLIASMISDSLEEYYWTSVKHHEMYREYLKSFPDGKYKDEAVQSLKKNRVNLAQFVKKVEEEFEDGNPLDNAVMDIVGYQNNYPEESDELILNNMLDKFNRLKDTVSLIYQNLKSKERQDENKKNIIMCSFVSGNKTYQVEMDSLNKLPQKDGDMRCLYPLYSSRGVFAIVLQEYSIKNRKINKGKELGIDPRGKKVVYKNIISGNIAKGKFEYSYVDVLFDQKGYSIIFPDESDAELLPSVASDIIYLLSKNKNSARYLECIPFISIYNYEAGPMCRDDRNEKYEAKIKNGRIQSVSIKTDDETVYIPLNSWGEIDGVVKYWNSNIGNVEITVNANMPRGFDEKGKSKVVKVNIKGCTFTPPRKIISYKNTKSGKMPVYEKFTPKCEAVATETGMSILLDSIKSYRFRESEFIPKFLMIFLDWNKMN